MTGLIESLRGDWYAEQNSPKQVNIIEDQGERVGAETEVPIVYLNSERLREW